MNLNNRRHLSTFALRTYVGENLPCMKLVRIGLLERKCNDNAEQLAGAWRTTYTAETYRG